MAWTSNGSVLNWMNSKALSSFDSKSHFSGHQCFCFPLLSFIYSCFSEGSEMGANAVLLETEYV